MAQCSAKPPHPPMSIFFFAVDGAPSILQEAVHHLQVRRGRAIQAGEEGGQGRKGLVLQAPVHAALICGPHLPQSLAPSLHVRIILAALCCGDLALQDPLQAARLPRGYRVPPVCTPTSFWPKERMRSGRPRSACHASRTFAQEWSRCGFNLASPRSTSCREPCAA